MSTVSWLTRTDSIKASTRISIVFSSLCQLKLPSTYTVCLPKAISGLYWAFVWTAPMMNCGLFPFLRSLPQQKPLPGKENRSFFSCGRLHFRYFPSLIKLGHVESGMEALTAADKNFTGTLEEIDDWNFSFSPKRRGLAHNAPFLNQQQRKALRLCAVV